MGYAWGMSIMVLTLAPHSGAAQGCLHGLSEVQETAPGLRHQGRLVRGVRGISDTGDEDYQ